MLSAEAKEKEARLAQELDKRHEARLITKRNRYACGIVVCLLASLGTALLEAGMFPLMFGMLALICLVQLLDANGGLEEVRNRPSRCLVPRPSVLKKPETPGKEASPSTSS